MEEIEKLTKLMSSFPGVGPRQARRFVYYLLQKNKSFSQDLAKHIQDIHKGILQCTDCMRFYSSVHGSNKCSICGNNNRENNLTIVHRDVDLEALEKAGIYNGYYFVLGGSIPVLDSEPTRFIRLKELDSRIKNLAPTEIVLAFHLNPEGEYTSEFIKKHIVANFPSTKITELGRGLSTGSEIEYADKDTIKNAFINRR